MMRLTPHEILKHLGFDVPEDGVAINPADALLITESLRLAGATIDVGRVPAEGLRHLHHAMAGLVQSWSSAGQIAPLQVSQGEPSEESLMKLRATLGVLLTHTFGHR